MRIEQIHCCGACVYEGLTYPGIQPARHLCNIAIALRRHNAERNLKAIVTMYDVKRNVGDPGHTDELDEYIRERTLGTLTFGPWINNPNSGNLIQSVTWTVNLDNYEEWLRDSADALSYRREIQRANQWEVRPSFTQRVQEALGGRQIRPPVQDARRYPDQVADMARAMDHEAERERHRILRQHYDELRQNFERMERPEVRREERHRLWDPEARAAWYRDDRNRGLRPPWLPEGNREHQERLARAERTAAMRRRG